MDPRDLPVFVAPHARSIGVAPPGSIIDSCLTRGCTHHRTDWREPPGSPGNDHRVRPIYTRTSLVELALVDGCPVDRTVLACPTATRTRWLPRGLPDFDAGIVGAVRAAVAWACEQDTATLVFVSWHAITVCIEAARAPELSPDLLSEARTLRLSRPQLDRARELLSPILAAFKGEVHTAYFGALKGLDHLRAMDALVTLGDPRPNLAHETDRAIWAGTDPEGRLDALAAAELDQAHGRLRTVHRERPARALHVGAIVPASWIGRDVSVRRLATGRPRTVAAMTAEAFAAARTTVGLSLRDMGRALSVGPETVRRYESGERSIPDAVARAVLALVPAVPETPCRDSLSKGFRGHPTAPTRSGGFGDKRAQGVSGTRERSATGTDVPRFEVPTVRRPKGDRDA